MEKYMAERATGRKRRRSLDRAKVFFLCGTVSCLILAGCAPGAGGAENPGGGQAGAGSGYCGMQDGGGAEGESFGGEKTEEGLVMVSFLQTGEDADCVVICSGERAVMVDAGEAQDGERILQALEERGIAVIDYMILTHPDKDHAGGADFVLRNYPVCHVVEPVYFGEKEKEERFGKVNEYCEEKGIPVTVLEEDTAFRAGYLDFTIYPPEEKHYEKANNYSLAVLASHGEVHMFFTGDALRIRSEELLELPLPAIDLYKVPHHGRANKATEDLFEAVRPKYAVVTADTAEEEVAENCRRLGIRLFLTGEQEWDFVSDGKELTLLPGKG